MRDGRLISTHRGFDRFFLKVPLSSGKYVKSYCVSYGFNFTFLESNFTTYFLRLSWNTGCYTVLSGDYLLMTELNNKSSSPLIEARATDHTPEELLFDAVNEAEFRRGTRQISALAFRQVMIFWVNGLESATGIGNLSFVVQGWLRSRISHLETHCTGNIALDVILVLKKANAKRQAPSDRRNAVASILNMHQFVVTKAPVLTISLVEDINCWH